MQCECSNRSDTLIAQVPTHAGVQNLPSADLLHDGMQRAEYPTVQIDSELVVELAKHGLHRV